MVRSRRTSLLTGILGSILCIATVYQPVRGLSATPPVTYSVTLSWNASVNPGVAGYYLFFGTTSTTCTNSIAVGSSTTNTITGLAGGVTYYFAAASYDTNGMESPVSDEISYTTPTGLQTVGMNAGFNQQGVLTVTGQIGLSYNILATQDFKTWTVIGAVTIGPSGLVDFIDTNAASYSRRFYQTQQQP